MKFLAESQVRFEVQQWDGKEGTSVSISEAKLRGFWQTMVVDSDPETDRMPPSGGCV